ncbi:hypothetical protein BDR07DRAFT_1460408 [Suillus spraguei]|nr:hypothetical protein BDR07DRAFT_1460408 [Suillus spraguei]
MTDIFMYHQYLCVSMATFWLTFLLRSRWTKVKCLYIIARNAPFVILTTDLYRVFSSSTQALDKELTYCISVYYTPHKDPERCLMLINIYSSFSFISVVCSESIFVVRTYALWNNNKKILVATICTAIVFVIASINVDFTAIAASHVTTSAIPGITGCYRTSRGVQLSMPFLLLLIFELGLISLTFIRAMQNWRRVNGPLYTVLVKHNIFYYACGLLLAAVNVLMPMLFSQYAYHSVFENFQFYVLAILATRMHLHIWDLGWHHHIRDFDDHMLAPMSDISPHCSRHDAPVFAPMDDASTADRTA